MYSGTNIPYTGNGTLISNGPFVVSSGYPVPTSSTAPQAAPLNANASIIGPNGQVLPVYYAAAAAPAPAATPAAAAAAYAN